MFFDKRKQGEKLLIGAGRRVLFVMEVWGRGFGKGYGFMGWMGVVFGAADALWVDLPLLEQLL